MTGEPKAKRVESCPACTSTLYTTGTGAGMQRTDGSGHLLHEHAEHVSTSTPEAADRAMLDRLEGIRQAGLDWLARYPE